MSQALASRASPAAGAVARVAGKANQPVGRLDGLASIRPDLSLFCKGTFVRRRCFPSQAEGTQSSLLDLMLFETDEAPGAPIEDVEVVSNYVAEMHPGLQRLREGFPLSLT